MTQPMTEERARALLGDAVNDDGGLYCNCGDTLREAYVTWNTDEDTACLDGHNFTADQLEAIAWWMRNKGATR